MPGLSALGFDKLTKHVVDVSALRCNVLFKHKLNCFYHSVSRKPGPSKNRPHRGCLFFGLGHFNEGDLNRDIAQDWPAVTFPCFVFDIIVKAGTEIAVDPYIAKSILSNFAFVND